MIKDKVAVHNQVNQIDAPNQNNQSLIATNLVRRTFQQQNSPFFQLKITQLDSDQIAETNAKITEEMGSETTEPIKTGTKLFQWIQLSNEWVLIMLGAAVYLMFIFGFLGYLQARIGNLVWNNTSLEKLSFSSSLRARDFAWIYFINILAIMLTIGLATPWAQIRLARYRATKLFIISDGDFEGFVGDKKAEVKAAGEEIAEMFDVDLSFG